jgi:uncharacterized protein (DUF433 family)
MEEQLINQYIERVSLPEEEIGYPRIRGRRISVVDVILWLQSGLSIAEIAVEYDLTDEAILAAEAFYEQNRAEIDHYILEGEAFFEAGLQAQQQDPIYLGLKARRESLVLRERPTVTLSNP